MAFPPTWRPVFFLTNLAVAGTLFSTIPLFAADATPDQVRFFEERVRPILVTKCQRCHGDSKQKGGLRLDSREALATGGESGAAIEPGKPDDSLLWQMVDGELVHSQLRRGLKLAAFRPDVGEKNEAHTNVFVRPDGGGIGTHVPQLECQRHGRERRRHGRAGHRR